MLIVGIGEYVISNNVEEQIVTYALGSCIAFIIHCPITRYTAMAHVVLPENQYMEVDGLFETKPGYYASDIVPRLLEFFINEKNCPKEYLEINLVGGAKSLNQNDCFMVGERNSQVILGILASYNLLPSNILIGGHMSRTVSVSVCNGMLSIKEQKMII